MTYSLLFVDDEPAIRAALRRAFQRDPYQISEAGDAEQALAILAARPVDLVFSDQNMPGQSGMDLFQQVQRLYPDTIRILMTGQADLRLALQAAEQEVLYSFVRKPWDLGELGLLFKLGLRHLDALRENDRLLELVRTQRRIIAELERGPDLTGGTSGGTPARC